jgi:hypothetical protein
MSPYERGSRVIEGFFAPGGNRALEGSDARSVWG